MDSSDYTMAWLVYGMAGVIVTLLCWLVLRHIRPRELGVLLLLWLLALLYTPWYVLPDQDLLAPALIIFLMDALTIDMETAIRALIPLVMAMLTGLFVTIVGGISYRLWRRRRRKTAHGKTAELPGQEGS